MKPIVLVLIAHYLPGYRSGGPLRSVANIVAHLSGEYEFKIITADRDIGDAVPYDEVPINSWTDLSGVSVFYCSPREMSLMRLARLINSTPHDILYLNSFFSKTVSVIPILAHRFGLLCEKPIVLAPRGEFSSGALALKRHKKTMYIKFSKALGLHRKVYWQASSEFEKEDIQRAMGADQDRIWIASDLPASISASVQSSFKNEGNALKIVFLSRISAKKNLGYALERLSKLDIQVVFNIYGPAEDATYWRDCEAQISTLPPNIQVLYHGTVLPEDVPSIMASHDLFFLPTRGENYGHVIAEALSVGTPVLISDATPWRDLAKQGLGADLPLHDPSGFNMYIEQLHSAGAEHRHHLRYNIIQTYQAMVADNDDVSRNRDMFSWALDQS